MLARRTCNSIRSVVSAPRSTAASSRSFAVGAATQSSARAPALADITPDIAASFNKKQKEFRDGLVAAQKQKEQQESASLSVTLFASNPSPDECSTVIGKI